MRGKGLRKKTGSDWFKQKKQEKEKRKKPRRWKTKEPLKAEGGKGLQRRGARVKRTGRLQESSGEVATNLRGGEVPNRKEFTEKSGRGRCLVGGNYGAAFRKRGQTSPPRSMGRGGVGS